MSGSISLSISRGGEVGAALAEPRRDPRTSRLLEAAIVRTLLRMAAPNVLVMVAQASTGLVETYFVGRLGTDALAGVALVFPGVMLMQMMSAGAREAASRRRSRVPWEAAAGTTPTLSYRMRW
jgi:MatE